MGTFVMLLMFVAIVQGATFPGVLGGYVVQKIFYSSSAPHLSPLLALAGSFDFQFGNERTRSRTTRCSRSGHHGAIFLAPPANLLALGKVMGEARGSEPSSATCART
jgi:hypothetical protein